MAYLQNIRLINQYPVRHGCYHGALERSMWGPKPGTWKNQFLGAINSRAAFPNGYEHPSCWFQSRSPGNLSAYKTIAGEGNAPASLLMGINLTAPYPKLLGNGGIPTASMSLAYYLISSLTGSGNITAASLSGAVKLIADLLGQGGVVTSPLSILAWCESIFGGMGDITSATIDLPLPMSASVSGNGGITAAALVGLIYMLAELEGSGSIAPDLKFPANLSSGLGGQGNLETAILKAIAWCIANIIGEGTAEGSDLRGKSFMEAEITSVGDLVTAQSCAIAVWNSLAASFNNPETMGQLLHAAGSAGDPWITELPGTYMGNQAGALTWMMISCIKNKKKLEKIGDTWYFRIRNENDDADIVYKALKDKDGNDITDVAAGIMAQELASTV